MLTFYKILKTSPKILIPIGFLILISGSLIANAFFPKSDIFPNILVREISKFTENQTNKVIAAITASDSSILSSPVNETTVVSTISLNSQSAVNTEFKEIKEEVKVLVPGTETVVYLPFEETYLEEVTDTNSLANITGKKASIIAVGGGTTVATLSGGSGATPPSSNGPTASYQPSRPTGGPRPGGNSSLSNPATSSLVAQSSVIPQVPNSSSNLSIATASSSDQSASSVVMTVSSSS